MRMTGSTPNSFAYLVSLLKQKGGLLALASLFLLWRFVFLFFVDPVFTLPSSEELFRGAVAQEILKGVSSAIWLYRPDGFAGGFYPIVYLTALFFKLFGPSALSLRLLALVISAASLVTWYVFLRKHSSKKAATLFCLLFIFAPFTFVSWTLSTLGDHSETIVLSGLSSILLFQLVNHKKSALLYGMLGLVAGFSLWFAYIYCITLAAILIFGFLQEKFFWFQKKALYFYGGFLVGFSPWLGFNLTHDFVGFKIRGVPILASFEWHHLKLTSLHETFFLSRLLESLKPWDKDFYGQLILGSVYALLLGLMLVLCARVWLKNNRISWKLVKSTPLLFSGLYLLIFAFAAQVYREVGIRYLVPAVPFVLVFLSIILGYGLHFGNTLMRRGIIGFVSIMILIGAFSVAIRFSLNDSWKSLSPKKGYSYEALSLAMDAPLILKERLSRVRVVDSPEDVSDLTRALANNMELKNLEYQAREVLGWLADAYKPDFAYSLGVVLYDETQNVEIRQNRLRFLKSEDEALYENAVQGWGDAQAQFI